MEKRTIQGALLAWPDTDVLATARIANLREVADNLRTRKAAHRQFTFARYNSVHGQDEHGCGTAGCAIGDMPLLRPDAFMFSQNDPQTVGLRGDLLSKARAWEQTLGPRVHFLPVLSAMYWFRISEEMFIHLFMPLEQYDNYDGEEHFNDNTHIFQDHLFGGEPLDEDASAEEVAENIEAFCDKVEQTWPEIQEGWRRVWAKTEIVNHNI